MSGHLRIIGGAWRGRRLAVPRGPDLRPTGDRIRETLFNWVQARIPGARCLDLFAGSGVLGLEALSRGAAEVVFVERNARVAAALRAQLQVLDAAERGRVVPTDALRFLAGPVQSMDIVFLDPPFRASLGEAAMQLIAERQWLVPGGRLYLESDAHQPPPALPAGWSVQREKRAGGVRYALISPEEPGRQKSE
ncbi:16S rRNA (guanine(966)-N(2))-methyltransferase RsmD [Alkalilimnicola ehrlichii MLHE-1]|uniref:Ribosomal RNA small subunit methyltransferase D n=1 Tax=Alkalilimnicola ehrlichii (strain ATCC BAA-1101 / DSM 17681 / MLHE-1) TaxID=187272 RepID=Q0A591_ALKEH|nr:16S rRNA (guanine(966)-N(2))-methyltransferase RsmD [Alkalilimnicola ehrlichii]ABI57996.1 16S rRNA m(2)G-966 methyltransferase [Alkalilimnicola ehrlichii MLHE-1]